MFKIGESATPPPPGPRAPAAAPPQHPSPRSLCKRTPLTVPENIEHRKKHGFPSFPFARKNTQPRLLFTLEIVQKNEA